MRFIAGTIVAFVVMTGLARRASALELGIANIPASLCNVVNNSSAEVVAGSLSYTSSATGTITAYCPVDLNSDWPEHVYITYQDSTGTSTSSSVAVQLIQMNLMNGSITSFDTTSSNSFAATTGSAVQHESNFSNSPGTGQFAYYIRVDLVKAVSTDTVIFYGVLLSYDQ